jgi:hypothetical protein
MKIIKILNEDLYRIKQIYRNGMENAFPKPDNPFNLKVNKKRYNTDLIGSETFFCDLNNDELLNIIKKYIKLNEKTEYISNVHYIHYKEGEEAKQHRDGGSSIRTYVMMLNDEFEGGEFYLENIHIPFKMGEMIEFDALLPHSVSKIKNGDREVLVIWVDNSNKCKKTLI